MATAFNPMIVNTSGSEMSQSSRCLLLDTTFQLLVKCLRPMGAFAAFG